MREIGSVEWNTGERRVDVGAGRAGPVHCRRFQEAAGGQRNPLVMNGRW